MIERPIPCVVDTNVVMLDVLRYAEHGHTALRVATQIGALKTYASIHVIDEVYEHLPELAKRRRVPRAIAAWKAYSEGIAFVEVPETLPPDPRVIALAQADADDVPTGILVSTLAPCISLSQDPHVVDAGLASPEWLRLALSSRDIGHAFALKLLGGGAMVGTGFAGAGVVKLVAALSRSPAGRVLLGIGAVASYLGLRRSYERGWEGPLRAREALRQGLTKYGDELVRVELLAEKARGVIEDALITPIEATRGMQAVRVLALAREPMTSTEVGRALIDEGQALPKALVNDIRREFGTSTMARKATEHRWELSTWEVS